MSKLNYERIWLHDHDDDVTWCQDKISDDDVGFISLEKHEALEQELSKYKEAWEARGETAMQWKEQAEKAEQENEQLKTALEFYAPEVKYKRYSQHDHIIILNDNGKRAREALGKDG